MIYFIIFQINDRFYMKWIPNLLSSQGLLYTSKDELEMRVGGLELTYLYLLWEFQRSLRNDDVSFACFWARLILFINEERDEEASIGGRIAREEESHCLATNQNDDDDGCTFWRRIIIPSHDMFWALNSRYQSFKKITHF